MTQRDGQRRSAVILFADLQGSTPLAEQVEDEAFFDIIQQVHTCVLSQVEEHGGTVQEVQGDGVLALFGAPLAIEDAPIRACRTALRIQEDISTIADKIEPQYGVRPQLRIGLHVGTMLIGNVGTPDHAFVMPLGDDVNLAARLQTAAEGGTVLLTTELQALVVGRVEATLLGQKSFKGMSSLHTVYRLERVKQGTTRFQATHVHGLQELIGRDRELAALHSAWRDVRDGNLRVLCVTGVAGVGKSRLIYEFRSRLIRENAMLLEGNCDPDSATHPYLPFIEIVRMSFAIDPDSDAQTAAKKMRRGVEVLGLEANDVVPYLVHMLGLEMGDGKIEGLDPGVVGVRTRNAIHVLVRARCKLTPTVVFLEDLHWRDTATDAVIAQMVKDESLKPLLIVCTYRSGYAPAWENERTVERLELDPLQRTMAEKFVSARLGVSDVPDVVVDLIEDKTDGNPLFIEEILNYLLETSRIQIADGQLAFEGGSEVGALPFTVENMLMDRVDRLPSETRRVLEAAAVTGRLFDIDVAAQAAGLSDRALLHLEKLIDEDVVTQHDDNRVAFKHALLREAVYLSLLTPQRQALHEQVAAVLENLYTDRLFEVAETLAHHYSQTQKTDKAIEFLALAGRKSLGVYSLHEAEARFQQAIELADTAPGTAGGEFFVDLLLNMMRVHYLNADFRRIAALGEYYLSRVEMLSDQQRLSQFLVEVGCAHSFLTNHETAKLFLERALRLAQEIGDDRLMGYASMGLLQHYTWGEPASDERRAKARELGQQALNKGLELNDVWLASKALAALSTERALWGRPDEAQEYARKLFQLSENTGNPRPRCEGLYRLAYASVSSGDYDDAIHYARESLSLSLSPVDHMLARHPMAMGLILQGERVGEGFEMLEALRYEMQMGGFRIFEFFVDLPYGVALMKRGKLAKGVRYISREIDRYSQKGQPLAQTYGHWMLGEVYLQTLRKQDKPDLRFILKNIGFVVFMTLFGARRARYHLEIAAEESRRRDIPAQLAKSLYALGLLSELEGKVDDARNCFEQAHDIAKTVDAERLSKEIGSKLALGP